MRWPGRLLALSVITVVLVLLANVVAEAHDAQLDLSAQDSYTLSPETVGLLGRVNAPLDVVAFLTATGPDTADAEYLLARYQEVNRRIHWKVVDPDANPGEARAYGVSTYSVVILTYEGRRVSAPAVDESDLSTAILRLLRGKVLTACVMSGNGEPSLGDSGPDGLADVDTLLKQNAYQPKTIDLTLGTGKVPAACSAVLDLGPQEPYSKTEIDGLQSYLRAGGRLMVLTSSLSDTDPNPVLQPWGIGFLGGLVLDPARSEGVDWSNVVVQDLPSVSPVDQGVSSLQLPAPSGLVLSQPSAASHSGLTVTDLADTSSQSYIDPNPEEGNVSFGPGDIAGPVVVAAAADDSRIVESGRGGTRGPAPGVTGPSVVRTRLLVVGCDTWMTNGFLGNLGNRRFFANAVDWLTSQDDLVVSVAVPPSDRPLPLTPSLQAEILAVTVGGVPGALVLLALVRLGLVRRRERRGGRR